MKQVESITSGTVTIPLHDYEVLKEMQKTITEGGFVCFHRSYSSEIAHYFFGDRTEAINLLESTNKALINQTRLLNQDISKFQHTEKTMASLSVQEFKRWRKNNKPLTGM